MLSNTLISRLVAVLVESNEINFAFASLLFYDYTICFGEEVEYFWSGPWSLSRLLYLTIRYMSLGFALWAYCNACHAYSSNYISGSQSPSIVWPFDTSSNTTLLLVKLFVFVIPISILCQSVITLRVWYLFSRNRTIRILAIAMLFATAIACTLLATSQWGTIRSEVLSPQLFKQKSFAWVYRFFTSPVRMRTNSLLWGFVKEGMFMYVFAMASLLFGIVGLTMVEPSQLSVRIPAAIASPIVTTVVVSVCRVMLSIHSVAATAHVDPEWLLNHAELSRVHWRRGNADGEIIVEAGEFGISFDTKCP